jgi:hypothetical protein
VAVAKCYKRSTTGKLIVPLTVYLAPEVAERLTARAHRENHSGLAALGQAVLDREEG